MQILVPSIGNMDIDTVNALCYEDFVKIFGNLVEKCPIITAAVWSRRPFVSFTALETEVTEFIDALPQHGEIDICSVAVLGSCLRLKCNWLYARNENYKAYD